jgi:hypothetical protein
MLHSASSVEKTVWEEHISLLSVAGGEGTDTQPVNRRMRVERKQYLQNVEKVETGGLAIDENLALLGDGVGDGVNGHLVDRSQCLFNENRLHAY